MALNVGSPRCRSVSGVGCRAEPSRTSRKRRSRPRAVMPATALTPRLDIRRAYHLTHFWASSALLAKTERSYLSERETSDCSSTDPLAGTLDPGDLSAD